MFYNYPLHTIHIVFKICQLEPIDCHLQISDLAHYWLLIAKFDHKYHNVQGMLSSSKSVGLRGVLQDRRVYGRHLRGHITDLGQEGDD